MVDLRLLGTTIMAVEWARRWAHGSGGYRAELLLTALDADAVCRGERVDVKINCH
jgi:hypothetical protein